MLEHVRREAEMVWAATVETGMSWRSSAGGIRGSYLRSACYQSEWCKVLNGCPPAVSAIGIAEIQKPQFGDVQLTPVTLLSSRGRWRSGEEAGTGMMAIFRETDAVW
jgi:hypothetical protein